jgi:hypothetical protein
MTARGLQLTDPPRAHLAHGLDRELAADTLALAEFVATAFGDSTRAVIHYGSRAQGRRTRPESAYDFFVLVSDYDQAYRALARATGPSSRPRTAATLARVLPPNVIAVVDRRSGLDRRAKCAVLSETDFRLACSSRARDHFVQGRLMQSVVVAWARDAESEHMARRGIAAARARTFTWGRTSLPERFGVVEYCRALLRTSLAGEIRTESPEHALTLVEAQRDALLAIYTPLLDELAERGLLTREGETYTQRETPRRLDALRARLYFQRSKARATLRLLKYVALYEGWLDYIQHKIARSSGEYIELTERERRWPFIFLWPKVVRYLRTRPQRRNRHEPAG